MMEAIGYSQGERLVEVGDRAGFAALAVEWNALADELGATPFMRHEFLRIWIDNFAPGAPLSVLTVRGGGGQLLGALPLMRQRAMLCGVPVRQLVSTSNAHS